MSFPNIPDVNPNIDITQVDAINLLLASIAFEELGLSHIINAEAEKIQHVLGTLPGETPPTPPTIDDLLNIDRSVEQVLRSVIKNQMLLQFKLEEVAAISTTSSTTSTTTTTTTTTTSTTTSTSTTTTTTSTTTTTTSTTSTTTSTTSTTTSTTSTTTSTTTTTTSTTTTTTTTTTTSTTTTTTTTTKNCCINGSGNGDLDPTCPLGHGFNKFNIQDPRFNATCCGGTGDNNLAFFAQLIPSPGGANNLRFQADLNNTTVTCSGNKFTATGTGTVTLSDGTTGSVTFTLIFTDVGGPGTDLVNLVTTGISNSNLSFSTCGDRTISSGNIVVGTCAG